MKSTLVFLHPHFLLPGGASKVVLEQASRLTKKKVNCLILTTKIKPELISSYPNLKIRQISTLSTGNLLFWLSFPVFFYNLVRQLNAIPNKVIYCHSLALYWGYIYKLFFPKTKLIFYFHDLGFPYFDSEYEANSLPLVPRLIIKVIKPIFMIFRHHIVQSPDFIIANSHASAKLIDQLYHRSPNIIITPGVDLKTFKPVLAKKDYLVTVGRLDKIKNFDTTIKGLSLYFKNNKNSKLILQLAGQGSEISNLKKIVSLYHLGNKIKFLGSQTPQQLAILYAQAKLGIFMSPSESFGLTAIECLACGTPIIGVDQNGILEITKQFNRGFCTANSPIALAKKLASVLPQINSTINHHARQSVLQYSWDYQINKLDLWLKSSLS